MQFNRKQTIESYQEHGRVVMIYGPRRVGKTTMVKSYLSKQPAGMRVAYETGDDLTIRVFFEKQDRKSILDYARQYDIIAIDEAQLIQNIGVVAKIIIDEYPEKKIILTGSSSFELAQQTGEPLVGRQYVMPLLPVALSELALTSYEQDRYLEEILLYGCYPEIVLQEDHAKKREKLEELITSYLFKDILALDKIKFPNLLLKVVTALAHQIGSEVSLTKLAKDVDETDHKIIARYIDVLQKTFVIHKVDAYSTNMRNEIRKNAKYFFYDVGLRNAIIGNFKRLEERDAGEVGHLWENYVFMELYKRSGVNRQVYDAFYFWRTTTGKEVDIVQTGLNDAMYAYECKWRSGDHSFTQFKALYPRATCAVVTSKNYKNYIL